MEERERQCNREEKTDGESPTGQSRTAGEPGTSSTWRNGQCVASVPTSSWFTPKFDFSRCRTLLETKGFQIPADHFEGPLELALDHPSVRRYLLFNSYVFNFIMAPILYMVLWCAVYSTLHMYLQSSRASFWVLCLCVSLVSIILTAVISLIFHYSNREINMNTDVRLVGVNERMIRHGLLLGVADWVHKCRGKLQQQNTFVQKRYCNLETPDNMSVIQTGGSISLSFSVFDRLFCVYWDLSPCLRSLTESLDNMSFFSDQVQNKLKKRMSHLVLVTEVTTLDPEAGLQDEGFPEEEQPLLVAGRERSESISQRDDSKLTKNFSLMPNTRLSNQVIAQQLLMAYSALYVRLLVSNKLTVPSHRPSGAGKNHCGPSVCLCEYVELKALQ